LKAIDDDDSRRSSLAAYDGPLLVCTSTNYELTTELSELHRTGTADDERRARLVHTVARKTADRPSVRRRVAAGIHEKLYSPR